MHVDIRENVAHIYGATKENWAKAVELGHNICKESKAENVVVESEERKMPDLTHYLKIGEVDEADIVIIGGGVTGCGIARELSRYKSSILVLEKCSDIAEGTTKANNGMIHSGYDSKYGSLKAKLNVAGNAMYSEWAEDLGFKFNRTGSFVCVFNEGDMEQLRKNYENGVRNAVPGIALISGDEARKIEPALSEEIISALWTPTAGYVEPYEVTLKLMENAIDNGARLRTDCQVMGFLFSEDKSRLTGVVTTQGIIKCRYVVNAAGLYADDIAWYAGDGFYTIHPRRGVLVIFDKQNPCRPQTFVGMAPGNFTKGGGPMLTPDGTMIWGPSAEEIWDKEDMSVDHEGLQFVLEKGYSLLKGVGEPGVINYFAGNRAATFNEDFIICNSKKINNFTHVSGIQSPGLASSPAIAQMVIELLGEKIPLEKKLNFKARLKKVIPFRELPPEQRQKETIICRCELVTEREVVEAIHGKVPARSLDAVKRRTRAGMGRCQSGFCGAKVLEILARELGIDPTEVTLKGKGSQVLLKNTRQV